MFADASKNAWLSAVLGAGLAFPALVHAQVTYYWDINNATAGASSGTTAAGTWSSLGSDKTWSTDSTGQSFTSKWTGGIAAFSAGTNATGAYTVTISSSGGGVTGVEGIVFEEGDVTLGGTGSITLAGTPTINVAAANATIATVLAGSTGITKAGAGTLVLSGANTYTGATAINAGTLSLGASNVLPDSSALTIASGATLSVGSFSETIGSLAGSGTLTIGSGGALSFSAGMSFSSGSIVLGGGTLNLSNFTHSLGTLTVTADSVLDFGSGASILSLNSLAVNVGATLTVTNWTSTVDYFYSLLDPGSAVLGRVLFSGAPPPPSKWQSYDSQITPVPEPSFYGAVLLGLCGLFAGWRRWQVCRVTAA